MWQKGPGEGFHAAKDDALAINPKLKCRAIRRAGYHGGPARLYGYVVEDETGKVIGKSASQARDAWGAAFFALGGSYKFGRAVLPGRAPVEQLNQPRDKEA